MDSANDLRKVLAAVVVATAVKSGMDMAPDGFVASVFMLPAARLATLYWGIPLLQDPIAFSARGVTLEVTRACAATDFFSLAFAICVFTLPLRNIPLRVAAAIPSAWLAAVVSNSLRLVLLAPADALFGASLVPAVHMAVGLTVFLPVLCILWYTLRRLKSPERKKERKNKDPAHER